MLSLELLDGFRITRGGRTVALTLGIQRVVAFIALQDRPVSRTYVAGTLWCDRPEERANGNLRTALWRAGLLGPLLNSKGSYIALSDEVEVDVRGLLRQAHGVLRGVTHLARNSFDRLISCGDLLPGWYEDWVVFERERIRQLRLHGLEALCQTLTRMKRFGEAVEAGLAAVAAEPSRETAHRVLIEAYLAEGNRGEALRQYDTYRRLVRAELGVEPSGEMDRLLPSRTAS